MNPIKDKHIILGVTGSIACYKAADLASKLTQAGALVNVILTESAIKFVQPVTFQSVTGRKAYIDKDLWNDQGHVTHIGLGHAADLVVIAPATANTMAKLAHGIADNLMSVTSLAATCQLPSVSLLVKRTIYTSGIPDVEQPVKNAIHFICLARSLIIINPTARINFP